MPEFNPQAVGIDEFNQNIINNVISELKKDQTDNSNMGNHYEVGTGDIFSGQQASYGNLAGHDLGGPDEDGRANNIDLKELQRLWEKNL